MGHNLGVAQKVSQSLPKSDSVDLDVAAQVLSKLKPFILGFAKKMQESNVYECKIKLTEYQNLSCRFLTTADTSPFTSELVFVRIGCTVIDGNAEDVETCKSIERTDE